VPDNFEVQRLAVIQLHFHFMKKSIEDEAMDRQLPKIKQEIIRIQEVGTEHSSCAFPCFFGL